MEDGPLPARKGREVPDGRGEATPLEALTGEEVRSLLADLGEDLPAGSPRPAAAPGVRVLVVSRRPGEVSLLRKCIENAGSSVSVARDPFSALDRIRAERPDALISDFDLWGGDGALLFERIRGSGRALPVLFVADRARAAAAGLAERARSAGAAGLLLKPLKAWEVETEVRSLLELARESAASVLRAGDSASEIVAGESANRADAPWEPRGDGDDRERRAPEDGDSRPASGELPWLRFFREGSRLLLRPGAPRPDPAASLLQAAREELGASVAGLFHVARGRPVARLEGGEGMGHEVLARLASLAADSGSGPERTVVSFGPPGRGDRLVLAGLAPGVAAAAPEFREDIRALLESLFGT